MKTLKRMLCFMAMLALTFTLSDCAGEASGMTNLKLKESNFKSLGRVYYDDDKIYCALSGSGVEFRYTGAKCIVEVEGDSTASDSSMADNQARIAIYVNGERKIDEMIYTQQATYELDTSGETVIRIIKLSESPMSTFAITGIEVDGSDIAPTEDSDILIEFVGDSITCGYGVDDEDMNHHFSTKTEDVTKTYAFKTAESLGADWSMVSFSGYGIISGYSDGTNKISAQTVPQYYTKLGYSWNHMEGFTPSDIEWEFKRQPDIIVVNLGTNDDSYCKNIPERCNEFKAEYIEFLKLLRSKNPDASIIGTLGIMGQNLCSYVEAAINDYSDETGDKNVYFMTFDNQNMADGIAADWHPTEKTHGKAAEKLVAKINDVMGK